KRIEGAVCRDLVQPCTDRRAGLVALEASPGGEQSFLEQVLCVLGRPDDPVDVHLEFAPIRVGQLAERILVAGACTLERPAGHARILARTGPLALITVMTSAPRKIRRPISLAETASTHDIPQAKQGDSRWERSWSARTSPSTASSRTRAAREEPDTAAG